MGDRGLAVDQAKAVRGASAESAVDSHSSASSSRGRKYSFHRYIGGGSFGEIYSADCLKSGRLVAVKVEAKEARNPQLKNEFTLYKTYLTGATGFPEVYDLNQTRNHKFFAMEMLGENLEALFERCNRSWSPKTVVHVAIQLMTRLETFHGRTGYVHRDIKPENLVMGKGDKKSTMYLVDLGLAKSFRDKDTGEHIPSYPKPRKSLTGTARYASVRAHLGEDQTRRDDMESAGYVLVYFCKGHLPWQGMRAATKKERYERIRECKMATPTRVLCSGLVPQMHRYMQYVKELSFDEKPNYEAMRNLFREVLTGRHLGDEEVFDWMPASQQHAPAMDANAE